MKHVYIIFHNDGGITLVEQTPTERLFTPVDSLSQVVNALSDSNADIPDNYIITETESNSWSQQLNRLTAERVSA